VGKSQKRGIHLSAGGLVGEQEEAKEVRRDGIGSDMVLTPGGEGGYLGSAGDLGD